MTTPTTSVNGWPATTASKNTIVINNNNKPTYHGHMLQSLTSHITLSFDISPVKVLTEDHYRGDHYSISVSLQPIQDPDSLNEPNHPNHLPPLWERKKDNWIKAAKSKLSSLTDTFLTPHPPSSWTCLPKTSSMASSRVPRNQWPPPVQNTYHPPKRWWNTDLSSMVSEIRWQAKLIIPPTTPTLYITSPDPRSHNPLMILAHVYTNIFSFPLLSLHCWSTTNYYALCQCDLPHEPLQSFTFASLDQPHLYDVYSSPLCALLWPNQSCIIAPHSQALTIASLRASLVLSFLFTICI